MQRRGGVKWNQLYEPLAASTLKADGGKKIKNVFREDGRRVRGKKTGEDSPGAPMRDVWPIGILAPTAKERLGYPTQKPLALLDRIIEASSDKGDIVLDPFCGCGTTVESAHILNRRFVGIDISAFAIDLIRQKRFDIEIPAQGIPADLHSARVLAKDNPFNFESWAVTRLPGFAPNTKQVGDGGVDGRGKLAYMPDGLVSRLALAQAKSGKFNLDSLRAFLQVNNHHKSAFGCYISLDKVTSPSAKREAAMAGQFRIGSSTYNRMNLWSIEEHFDLRPLIIPPMMNPWTGKPIDQVKLPLEQASS